MGQHGHHKEYPKQATAVLVLSVIALLILIYGYGSAIEATAGSLFDLTPTDLYTIPIGSMAFVLFWQLMHHLVFKPLVQLIEAREAATEGAVEDSASAKEEAQRLQEEYNSKLTAARVEGMQKKAQELNKARKASQELLDTASQSAIKEISDAREQIIVEGDALRAALVNDTEALVSAVVEKVQQPAKSDGVSQ